MKLIFIICLLLIFTFCEDDGNRKIRQLRERSENSPNRIIKIDGKDFKQYLLKSPRPYTAVVYFTAQSCKFCEELYPEYQYLTNLYERNGVIDQQKYPVFFFLLEYNERSQQIFNQFEFNTAPNIVVSKPKMALVSQMQFKKYVQDFKWTISYSDGHVTTHKMLEFVNKRTGKNVVYKPTLKAMLTTISVFLAVAITGVLIYTKMQKFWMRWEVWFVGSLVWFLLFQLIYIVCVSGVVYDVIHDVPFVGSDGKGNVQVFSKGNRQQYGAEGLVISLLISFIALCFIFIHIVNKKMSASVTTGVSIVLLIIAFLFVLSLQSAYKDKGWYNPKYYPPGDYQKGWYLADQGNNI